MISRKVFKRQNDYDILFRCKTAATIVKEVAKGAKTIKAVVTADMNSWSWA